AAGRVGPASRHADDRRGRDLPADLRCRSDARVGVLAGGERAPRSADREDELRTDRRRRDVWRSGRRPGVGARRGEPRHGGEAAAPRRDGTCWRVAMGAMLPILAGMNLLAAWLIRRLATGEHVKRHTVPGDIASELSSAPP